MARAPVAATIADMSPRTKARLAGLFLLITTTLGILADGLIGRRLIVWNDPATTAANILSHAPLYQLAFALYLVEMSCQITMTALFYDLLKPVSKSLSFLALLLGFAGCIVKLMSRLFFYAPLLILDSSGYLGVFDPKQQQALAHLLLEVNDHGAAMAMVFFGIYAIFKGFLVYRSTFLPRALGVLSVLGGIGWLAFLVQPLGYRLFPFIAMVSLLAVIANIVWLLVFGVNEERWREQAAASAQSIWR